MRVALFGATGGTGRQLLSLLARSGVAEIRCLVRTSSSKERLGEFSSHSAVEIIEGSPVDAADVESTVANTDVVIVSLGGPAKGPGVDICSRSQGLVNAAVNKSNPDAHVICRMAIILFQKSKG